MSDFVLDIKGVKQKKLHCGPCCIEMVLRYYGYENIDQETIGKDINVKIKRGSYPRDVIAYLRRYDIIAEKKTALSTLKYLDKRRPIIIGTSEHFMLLVGKEGDKYIILDPATGRKNKYTYDFFREEVKDYIVIKEVAK